MTIIREAFEQKKYVTTAFIDIAQAFDKVWHDGLIHKIIRLLPLNSHKLLISYLSDRAFVVKINGLLSDPKEAKAGVAQGSKLAPFMYTVYTADMPTDPSTHSATFADDTALISVHENPIIASQQLQNHIRKVEKWLDLWRIRVNPSKCAHVTFALKRGTCPRISINGVSVPEETHVKYLGVHLDKRLTWTNHIEAKITQIKIKMAQLNWLLNRNSLLSLDNKLLIYTAMIKPIWSYGIQLWGSACASNVAKLQRRQSRILRQITNAPWYIRNSNIHNDLNIPTIKDEINNYCSKYVSKLSQHSNPLAQELLLFSGHRRLKRKDTLSLASNT